MDTTIFYFSATGNSLVTARKIAAELGDTELVSMNEAVREPASFDSPRIGFVFPVIAFGLPRTVAEFMETFASRPGQYCFAVVTCGGMQAATLPLLRQALRRRGGELDAGYAVRAADSCMTLAPDSGLVRFMTRLRGGEAPRPIEERLAEIAEAVRARRPHAPETNSWISGFLGSLLYKMGVKTFKDADRRFRATERCTRCGTCERVCPRGNIRVGEDGPAWNHDCQLCNACINWCPRAAIEYEEASAGRPRYHNPEVSVKDLVVSRA